MAPKKNDKGNPLKVNGTQWDRDKVMAHICDCIASSNKGLVSILAAGANGHALPDYTTICLWMREDDSLSQRYAIAKESQSDFMAEEMVEIADTCKDAAKARLQIDTRKWLASKLKAKKYGDKLDLNHAGSVEITAITRKIVK